MVYFFLYFKFESVLNMLYLKRFCKTARKLTGAIHLFPQLAMSADSESYYCKVVESWYLFFFRETLKRVCTQWSEISERNTRLLKLRQCSHIALCSELEFLKFAPWDFSECSRSAVLITLSMLKLNLPTQQWRTCVFRPRMKSQSQNYFSPKPDLGVIFAHHFDKSILKSIHMAGRRIKRIKSHKGMVFPH